jgi:hypothetical protein
LEHQLKQCKCIFPSLSHLLSNPSFITV